ncbi:MAG: cyclase family protein [Pyrinomonadaceae bacterium]
MKNCRIIADLSIPLVFGGPQPNAYGVEPATAAACEYGDLVGDTRRGGSCNFESVTLIPHCSGTHTECVGHITDERISVRDCLQDVLNVTMLVSVEPEKAGDGDLLITELHLRSAIQIAAAGPPAEAGGVGGALIVRTLPNDDSKLTRKYGDQNIPPYFTPDAMAYIVECGFKHLLVDLPSIDRIYDEGKLLNHRIFWKVDSGSFVLNDATRLTSTITELIYVPNEVVDGEYLLNLQIAPFSSDAAPSRPILVGAELFV